MRKVVYGGAMSLDGFIAGPSGEYDWIVTDPDIDFAQLMARYDTFLLGRKTYDAMRRMGGASPAAGRTIVISKTLRPDECPGAELSNDPVRVVDHLRTQGGKDIAVFGGGELFRSLLAAGRVDEVGVAVVPILLGGGVPFLPSPASRAALRLKAHRLYEKSGIVSLEYDVIP